MGCASVSNQNDIITSAHVATSRKYSDAIPQPTRSLYARKHRTSNENQVISQSQSEADRTQMQEKLHIKKESEMYPKIKPSYNPMKDLLQPLKMTSSESIASTRVSSINSVSSNAPISFNSLLEAKVEKHRNLTNDAKFQHQFTIKKALEAPVLQLQENNLFATRMTHWRNK